MIHLVKVRTYYDNNIKYYRINAEDLLQKGMVYVGATRFGHDLMEIHCPSRSEASPEEWQKILEDLGVGEDKKNSRTAYEPVLLYRAKDADVAHYGADKKDAEELLSLFRAKALEHRLMMKIVKLHFTHRREKLVCSYTAEQRVDFREYVKDIGSVLKVRIEMFQISPKDAITFSDACGICGRRLCCLTGCNLVRFGSDRKLPYSPKTAGICGKGRCCNAFEIPVDAELHNPELGGFVCGAEAMYSVRSFNYGARTITLSGPEGEVLCSLNEIHRVEDGNLIRFEYHPESHPG